MNKIKFSHNWNKKLDCNTFTTIRKSNREKFEYYQKLVDKVLEIYLNDKLLSKVYLREVWKHQYMDIPTPILRNDVGLIAKHEIDEVFKRFGIYNHTDILILTFERV